MIFQEPMTALNPLYTVGNQIARGARAARGRCGKKRARGARRSSCSQRTGIPEPERRVDAYPHQLSGGQRQRAMIAMALACRPKLLIADEPTTALDVTIQAQILALLDELQREMGMALLFITHDLNLVRRFTHRVGVMERGRLVESGRPREVFAHPQHPYTMQADRQPAAARGAAGAGRRAACWSRRATSTSTSTSAQGWFRKRSLRRRARRDARAAARRDARHRRRIGLGQDDARHGAARAAADRRRRASTLDGTRIDDADRATLRAMRRRMQVVFQDPFASLSARA